MSAKFKNGESIYYFHGFSLNVRFKFGFISNSMSTRHQTIFWYDIVCGDSFDTEIHEDQIFRTKDDMKEYLNRQVDII